MTNFIKNKFLILFLYFISASFAISQQRFINNLRLWNDMMMNPAKIMENHGTSIYLSHRQQFWRLGATSPNVTIIGGKTNLSTYYSQNLLHSQKNRNFNYNYAIGGYYIHSYTGGVYEQNEICGQFGIQWKLKQTRDRPHFYDQINAGISIKGINNRYRGNSIYLYDKYDPVYSSAIASNKYAISVVPGIQYVNDKIQLDGFYTFGPKDQQFASLTIMGSSELTNFFNKAAFRINYFGNPNCQLSFNKVHDLGWGISNQVWSLNYGTNIFIGKKFASNSSFFSNPGIFLGIIYKNSGKPSKKKADYRTPMYQNLFSGVINLVDANLNTIALGPSAEAGFMYSRNSSICECDRIYDRFIVPEAKKIENLETLKSYESEFISKCKNSEYGKGYNKYIEQIRKIISDLEEDAKSKQALTFESCMINGQEWHCQDLSFTEGITFVSSQAEWDKLSPTKACYCYINFDERYKNNGFLYNSKAYKVISNNTNLKKSGFRVAEKQDWDKLFNNAKKNRNTELLYNCDGRSANGFNLKPSGYYDQDEWYTPDMGQANYWVSEENVYGFQCESKGEIMPDEIETDLLKNRIEKSAFLIRIIKN